MRLESAVKLPKKALSLVVGLVALAVGSTVYAQDEAPEEAAAVTADSSSPEASFNRELLTIEEEVNGLKERVFRSKATLQLLKEIVIQGATTGSSATIWHVNELGKSYTLESISYFLDGQGRFSKSDPGGSLDASREFKVFEGAVPPGEHNVTVNVKLRGSGFGIFKYVEKYEINFKANTSFVAEEGKSCQVRVVLEKRKGIGQSFTERPNVNFDTRCVRMQASEGAEGTQGAQ